MFWYKEDSQIIAWAMIMDIKVAVWVTETRPRSSLLCFCLINTGSSVSHNIHVGRMNEVLLVELVVWWGFISRYNSSNTLCNINK